MWAGRARATRPGEIREWPGAAFAVAQSLGLRLATHGGAALVVDYGSVGSGSGDTLQAVRGHAFADPLAEPGEADLTVHVDFRRLLHAAAATGARIHGPVTQGAFLEALGIRARAEAMNEAVSGRDPGGLVAESDRRVAAERMEQSFGGRLGRALEPALAPLGFDWKIGVGLIGAFAAREVFVSTMAVVYGLGADDGGGELALRDRLRTETRPDGSRLFTPLVCLSLMVFFALSCQCMSTLAVVRRETSSWRWPAFLFGYMTVLAWLASFLVYQGGRWLGFV